jgi:cell division protein FtsW
MAVTVNLIPVTGITLPLVSMGGTSIWFTSLAIGIILSVSRNVEEAEGKKRNADEKEAQEMNEEEMNGQLAMSGSV